jgi:hypothetical protein
LALQALDLYPDQVRLVYHHYPDRNTGVSLKIAESLEFSGSEGKFWEIHDRFTLDVPEDISDLMIVAEEVGFDITDFTESLDNGEYTEAVLSAIDEAQNRGVSGIALFINDTEYMKYPGTLDDLTHAIDEELNRIATNGQS